MGILGEIVARETRSRAPISKSGLNEDDALEFIEGTGGLQMGLYPVQRVILKAHYGIPLSETYKFEVTDWRRQNAFQISEADYLRKAFDEGRCNIREVVKGHQRQKLVLPVGRRSGKTTISAGVAAVETRRLIQYGNPQKYFGISTSNVIQLISVATDKAQAGLLYNEVDGHFHNCPYFSGFLSNNTQSYSNVQTPNDIQKYGRWSTVNMTARSSVRVTFKSCVAKGLRGSGNYVVVLDEVAHFTGKTVASAEKVYEAVSASTAAFSRKDPKDPQRPIGPVESRILLISSPLGKDGFFYNSFRAGFLNNPDADGTFCLQAPTWEVNPTVPADFLQSKYYENPRSFFTEYGAEFSDRTSGWIEDRSDLLDCVDPRARPTTFAAPRTSYFVGVDLGLTNDSTAVAIGHREEDTVVLDLVDSIKAGEGKFADKTRLEFEDAADWVASFSRQFNIQEGIFDQWSGVPFEQALERRGLKQFKSKHFSPRLSSEVYKAFKDLMWDKKVRLYNWPIPPGKELCAYLEELLALQAEMRTKDIIVVQKSRQPGASDDVADAIARMVWLASKATPHKALVTSSRSGRLDLGLAPPRPTGRLRLFQSGSDPLRQVPRKGRFR